jgi:CRP-like cAMP-binding protein
MPNTGAVKNLLLCSLPRDALDYLVPRLKRVKLVEGQYLERAHTPIQQVYFLEAGLASVVASKFPGLTVEVGLIGREGMTGTALSQDDSESPFECFVQMAGSALMISADNLRKAFSEVPSLVNPLLRYARALGIQTTYTALASAQIKVEERLARWILMVHDRVDGDVFFLTHEFLAMMLGVRRPGVTDALRLLEEKELIRTKRKEVMIVNRAGLVFLTRNTYGPGELEYLRLLGTQLSKPPVDFDDTTMNAA